MKAQDNQAKISEATEIIELACGQLEMLARSFECIAQIADSGQLRIVPQDASCQETIN